MAGLVPYSSILGAGLWIAPGGAKVGLCLTDEAHRPLPERRPYVSRYAGARTLQKRSVRQTLQVESSYLLCSRASTIVGHLQTCVLLPNLSRHGFLLAGEERRAAFEPEPARVKENGPPKRAVVSISCLIFKREYLTTLARRSPLPSSHQLFASMLWKFLQHPSFPLPSTSMFARRLSSKAF